MSTVKILPSSIYIVTQPLTSDRFHWAIVVTNAAGIATRHHWAADTRSGSLREAYRCQALKLVLAKSLAGRLVLGYFRIAGSSVPPDDILFAICAGVFPTSYPTPDINRRHGLTCRTWVMEVLFALEARGYIQREKGMAGVEQKVTQRSQALELTSLQAFVFGKSREYMSVVEDV
ncbi:hypothetical protein PLICRDRAFT_173237 [Plicaturopsis crispa FD-325 SS-3]|nr:hypothetical protein PLICRDRAFT_173237 [Plicaturopsis crispa FD-325 SS-3]